MKIIYTPSGVYSNIRGQNKEPALRGDTEDLDRGVLLTSIRRSSSSLLGESLLLSYTLHLFVFLWLMILLK